MSAGVKFEMWNPDEPTGNRSEYSQKQMKIMMMMNKYLVNIVVIYI